MSRTGRHITFGLSRRQSPVVRGAVGWSTRRIRPVTLPVACLQGKKPAARRRCGGGFASPTPGDPFSGSHKASAAVPALRNRPSAAASEVRGNHKGKKRSDGGKGKPTGHGRVERSCGHMQQRGLRS
ncbi:hypothetical protein BHM03_00013563 [Ensete ventricosum]|nr:hypothetical protein BHM03_00013563 [Ensete ventricosum]